MATLHLIGGEKGGVGKSVVARLLAQYLIDHELPFTGFDTDRSHGSLLRYYGDYASATVIDHYESLDAIIEAATRDPQQRILVDLAAQTHHPLSNWLDESGVLELLQELDIGLRYWNVMDSGRDSVDLLDKLLDQYGDKLNYVLVKNQLRDENFTIFDKSAVKPKAEQLGARSIDLKRLYAPVMTKIDANSYSFWAAKNRSDEADSLGLLERQRLKIWLNHAYGQIDGVGV